jgi:hypothetical protein
MRKFVACLVALLAFAGVASATYVSVPRVRQVRVQRVIVQPVYQQRFVQPVYQQQVIQQVGDCHSQAIVGDCYGAQQFVQPIYGQRLVQRVGVNYGVQNVVVRQRFVSPLRLVAPLRLRVGFGY